MTEAEQLAAQQAAQVPQTPDVRSSGVFVDLTKYAQESDQSPTTRSAIGDSGLRRTVGGL